MVLGGALILTGLSVPAMADSFIYTLTSDGCSSSCGTAPFGTVTVTDTAANQISLVVNVLPNFLLHSGQAGSTVAFNLNPNVNNLSLVSSVLPNWSLDAPSAGSLHFATFGNFEYSLNCCNSQNGSANEQTGLNTVVLSGTGLSAASFQQLSTGGAYFAVDIGSATTGQTGPVGAVDGPTRNVVPEPTSIVLLGSVAALIVGASRRKLAS